MKKPVVAIFSPNHNFASETFIKAHRDNINAEIVFYTDGMLPTRANDHPTMRFKYQLYYFLLKKIKRTNRLSLEEYALTKNLQLHRPDIVLCEYGICANTSLNVVKNLGLPMLVYFHGYDLSVRRIIDENNKYKDVIAYASKIFVVSREQEKRILELGAPKNKVIHNTYGPNDDYFKVVRQNKERELFVAAGRFTNKKAPYLTLLAFKKVLDKYPKAKLIIAGDGELYQVVRDLVKYYDMEKSVELPGVFDKEQLKKWFKQASAFVQHSVTAEDGNTEGTPVAILEAMASGLPVVSTRHAGIKDIIVHGKTGYLVDEYDVEAMAKQMMVVLDNPGKAYEVGLAGREFIKNNLTMKQHIAKIDSVISTCI